jgi:hypothetical protein
MREHAKPTKGSSKRFRSLLIITIVLVTAALAAGAAAVVSRQSARAQAPTERVGRSAVTNNAGDAGKNPVTAATAGQQQVQVESQTAELSPAEAQQLAAGLKPMLNKSSDDLQQVRHADGSVYVDLDDHFQNVVVAKVGKDGKVKQGCVDNPRAAGAFFGIDSQLIDGKESARPSTQPTRAKIRN